MIKKLFYKAMSVGKRHPYYLTSFLLLLSFPSYESIPFRFFPLWGWIAFVPLFHYIRSVSMKEVYRSSFFSTVLGAFFAFGWMRQFGKGEPGGELIIVLFLMPVIAFFWSARITAAEYFSRKNERFRPILFPAFWIIGDIIQSIGFLAFPWTYVGYSQFPVTPLVQIVSITGINGITFLMIMGNSLAADYFVKRKSAVKSTIKQCTPIILFVILIAFIVSWGGIRMSRIKTDGESVFRVGLIQSCISPWEDWVRNRYTYLDELTKLSNDALKEKPDLLIWSESATLEPISYYYQHNRKSQFISKIFDYATQIKTPIITGEIGIDEYFVEINNQSVRKHRYQNNAALIDSQGHVSKAYSKIHLCPFGEWFPYQKGFPWVKNIADGLGASDFYPGSDKSLFTSGNVRFGMLICYEGMFYRLNRDYALAGADFLVNITNDGWSDSFSGHYQHFAASVFRAVETGLPFVRAGNTGVTTQIDPAGRIVKSIPYLRKGYLITDISKEGNQDTFYREWGDIFSYIVIIFTCIIILKSLFVSKMKNRILKFSHKK